MNDEIIIFIEDHKEEYKYCVKKNSSSEVYAVDAETGEMRFVRSWRKITPEEAVNQLNRQK